ncbi:MAG: rod shape-determining protein MreC, partial [Planctomycetota bacterium]
IACIAGSLFLPRLGSVQATLGYLAAPVSHPANRIGNWMADRFEPAGPVDPDSPDGPRSLNAVLAENRLLRQQLGMVLTQLEQLKKLNADRDRLGTDLRPISDPLTVLGTVGEEADLLRTAGSLTGDVQPGMAVMHTGDVDAKSPEAGLAGIVDAVGLFGDESGVQIRLLSDPNHPPVGGTFKKFTDDGKIVTLGTQPFVVEGLGDGKIAILEHQLSDLQDHGVDNTTWVTVTDEDWHPAVNGVTIGRVVAIEDLPDKPQFARVVIEPTAHLQRLREVMVVTRR